VFRFIAGGTIEESQHIRQIYKQQLQVLIVQIHYLSHDLASCFNKSDLRTWPHEMECKSIAISIHKTTFWD
jgi:hypothetical protein